MTQLTLATLRPRLASRTPKQADATGRRQAAVAIVLAPGAMQALHTLFIRRAVAEDDPWSGQMAFPGGRREERDVDLLATAVRETLEETAVRLDRRHLLGVLDDLAPLTPTLPPVVVRPFVFGLAQRPNIRPSREVALHVWAPLEQLPASLHQTEVTVRRRRLTVPAYRAGSHEIWGMTHRIVTHLLDLALPDA